MTQSNAQRKKVTYKVTIKEEGIPYLTKAYYTTNNENLDDICRFLGCKNYNVEWYMIEKISKEITLSDFFKLESKLPKSFKKDK